MQYQYHFIRQDIPVVAQIIQMGHAIDRMSLLLPYNHNIASTVLIGVANEEELLETWKYLKRSGLEPEKDMYLWHEPDWPKGWQSIATRPMKGKERDLFSDFTLYSEVNNK